MTNIVILSGNVGQDPETSTYDRTQVTRFSMATSRPRYANGEIIRDKNGRAEQDTEWHRVTAFNGVSKSLRKTGFTGRFRALGINEPLTFVPAKPSEAENAPAYRILLGDEDGLDIGAGWSHVGEKAGEFVSIEIYSPPIGWLRAYLFRDADDDTVWSLQSNEPKKKRTES